MTVRAELIVPDQPVVPGGTVNTDLHVWNEGRVVDAYELTLLGPPGRWHDSGLGQLPVYPGNHEKIKIPIVVPRRAELRPGPMRFAVRVVSAEDPRAVAVPEAEIVIGAFRDLAMEIVRSQVSGRVLGSNLVVLRNTGNAPVGVRLCAAPEDPKAPVRARMRRHRLVLGVGDRARIGVLLRTSGPIGVGTAQRWSVKVSAEWDGGDVREAVFTYRHRAFLTKGSLKAATLLVAAVIAGAGLWASPIGGGTRTGQTQSLSGPAQQEQVKAAAAKATRNRKANAEKKRRQRETAGAPRRKPLQEALFVQVDGGGAGAGKSSQYTVKRGWRLKLTAVQITAVGDGTLLLGAGGAMLGSMALAQAKDIQPRTPVVVREGGKVVLTVRCAPAALRPPTGSPESRGPRPAPGPSRTASTCAASALLTGELIPNEGPFSKDPSDAKNSTGDKS